jgi:hypothetical protein
LLLVSFLLAQQRKRNELKITIDEETNELFRELKGLINGDLNSLLKGTLKAQIELKKNKKFSFTSEITAAATVNSRRTLTNSLKNEVFTRDKVCQKCGTIHYHNYDQIQAFALNGQKTTKNLRLLCSHCHQRERIKMKL